MGSRARLADGSFSPVDIASMSERMNHYDVFAVQDLVDDPIVAHPELVEIGKIAGKRLWLEGIEVLGKPVESFHDPNPDLSVEVGELASCELKNAQLIHRSGKSEAMCYVIKRLTAITSFDRRSLVLKALAQIFP